MLVKLWQIKSIAAVRKVFAQSSEPIIMVIHAIPTYPRSLCLLETSGVPTGIPVLPSTANHRDKEKRCLPRWDAGRSPITIAVESPKPYAATSSGAAVRALADRAEFCRSGE